MIAEYTDEAITYILKKFVQLPPVTNLEGTLSFLRHQSRFFRRFITLRPMIDVEQCEFYSTLCAYLFIEKLSGTSTLALKFASKELERYIFFLLLEGNLLDSILDTATPLHVLVNSTTGEESIQTLH